MLGPVEPLLSAFRATLTGGLSCLYVWMFYMLRVEQLTITFDCHCDWLACEPWHIRVCATPDFIAL
jgi:hypothetical protein